MKVNILDSGCCTIIIQKVLQGFCADKVSPSWPSINYHLFDNSLLILETGLYFSTLKPS